MQKEIKGLTFQHLWCWSDIEWAVRLHVSATSFAGSNLKFKENAHWRWLTNAVIIQRTENSESMFSDAFLAEEEKKERPTVAAAADAAAPKAKIFWTCFPSFCCRFSFLPECPPVECCRALNPEFSLLFSWKRGPDVPAAAWHQGVGGGAVPMVDTSSGVLNRSRRPDGVRTDDAAICHPLWLHSEP